MAIDAFKDELIAIPDVPKLLVNPVGPAALHVWWKHGINGAKLETVKVGRKRYTTKEALATFFRQRAKTADEPDGIEDGDYAPELKERLRAAGLLKRE